ncbi:MAG: hypothetical protein ACOC7T_03070 [Planctomycetota bacterium]
MLPKWRLLVASALLLATSAARADVGKTWTTGGPQRLAAGKLEGVSVLATGEVELAPEVQQIEGVEAEFIWDVEAAEDGTVYAGTGSPGALYRVRAGRAEALYRNEQQQVLSVLPLPDGSVLAGTAPEGIVLRVNRRGEVDSLADLPASYVWDMAFSPAHKILCATGPDGRLLELTRTGEVTERMKVEQKNLMCVGVDGDGNAYVGTEPDGYVYHLDPKGKVFVLYDAEESEVRDLLVTPEGVVYAGTAQSEGPARGGRSAPRPAQKPPSGTETRNVAPPRAMQGAPAAANSIYRIEPGRGGGRIARFEKAFVLCLGLAGERLLAGVGPRGRLAGIDDEQLIRIVTELEPAHITAIASLPGGGAMLGTANAGGLWHLNNELVETGMFLSKPFDAGYLSRWGKLSWKERATTGQRIRIRLRTGNTAEPDEHWSEWSGWVQQPAGEELELPMGRFAQFGAELSTRAGQGSPALVEVEVSYRQANRRPRIQGLAIDGKSLLNGEDSQSRRPSPQRPSRRNGNEQPSKKTIAWKAADPNEDKLTFDLYYRGTEEADWKMLEEDITEKPQYAWDTTRVPDGEYLLKLVARDTAVRDPDEAMSDSRVSAPVLVDNRPPSVADLEAEPAEGEAYRISGVAMDGHSAVRRMEVSHNSQAWRPVFPRDGIFDSRREPFVYETGALETGEHVFVFAVTDRNGNTGSDKIVVTAAGR